MTLELRLVKDGETLFVVPLQCSAEEARESVDLNDEEIERLSRIYSIAANERRLRALIDLVQRGEMSFSEILEDALNPKTVRDWMNPMQERGMVTHAGRRSPYRPSSDGVAVTMTITAGVSKLLDFLEGREEDEDLE